MRVVFFGTPEISAVILEKLCSLHEVIAVVTRPDKPQGRSGTPVFSPVKKVALEKKIPIYQPVSLKKGECLEEFRELKADLFVVVAYGGILPGSYLSIPHFGCMNIHFSLLPRWRGASPIEHTLLSGEQEAGVTFMLMDEGMDTGPILKKVPIFVEKAWNKKDLSLALLDLSLKELEAVLSGIFSKTISIEKQPSEGVSYAPKISKEELKISFEKSALDHARQIQAFSPKPGAWAYFRHKDIEKRCRFLAAREAEIEKILEPGEVYFEDKRFFIGCRKKALEVFSIQIEGKSPIDTSSFLLGYQDIKLFY